MANIGFTSPTIVELKKNGRLNGPHPSLEAAAASAFAYLSLQDIELALEALAARGEIESRVRPDGVRQYCFPR